LADSITEWLADLKLESYADIFRENGIDLHTLPHITEQDLINLGVLLGHRRLMLAAVSGNAGGRRAAPSAVKEEKQARGDRRQVSALFADISGFTSLSSQLGAEETHLFLNKFFDVVDGVIIDHGGTVDKHIGDAVMAIFGAPVAHTNDPERALSAAAAIHEAVAKFDPPVAVHIGVAIGQVVASQMGSDAHTEYTVTGDSVNLASRLTDLAPAGSVYVSEAVKRALGGRFHGRNLGPQAIDGLREPVVVHSFLHLSEAETEVRRTLVGRSKERAYFTEAFDRVARNGLGEVFLVRGEPGIGKTHLLDEVTGLARQKGYECLRSLVLDFGSSRGQTPVHSLVRDLLGIESNSSMLVRVDAVNTAIKEGVSDVSNRVHLNNLLEIEQPPDLANIYAAMDNATRIAGRQKVLSDLVDARCAHSPLLIAVEDIHWAEPDVLSQFALLAGHIAALPCIFIMSSRIVGDPIDQTWRATAQNTPITTVQLAPLENDEIERLAKRYQVANQDLLQECIKRSGGNPLFMEQLLINLDELNSEQLPGSIQGIVQARLDVLDFDNRKAIQAASVLGQSVSVDVLSHILKLPNFDVTPLVNATLLRPSGELFHFAHALIRDGAYESMLRTDRIALHRRAAEWYRGRDSLLFAHHLELAEDPAAPAAYLEAATNSGNVYEYEQAVKFLRSGLKLAAEPTVRFDLSCYLGEILLGLGRTAEAVEVLTTLIGTTQSVDQTYRLHATLGQADRQRSRYHEALKNLDIAEAAALEAGSDLQLANVNYIRGNVYFPMGLLTESLDSQEKTLTHARAAGSVQLQVGALSGFGDANYLRGAHRTAADYYNQAIALAREHELVRDVAANLHNFCASKIFTGEIRQLITEPGEAEAIARQYHMPIPLQLSLTVRSWISILNGDWETGEQFAREALTISQEIDAPRFIAQNGSDLARFLFFLGSKDEALSEAQRAAKVARDTGRIFCGPKALSTYARMLDDPTQQDELLLEGAKILEEGCVSHNHFFYYSDAIAIMLSRGEWDKSDAYAQALADYTRSEPLGLIDLICAQTHLLSNIGRFGETAVNSLAVEEFRVDCSKMEVQNTLSGLFDELPNPANSAN
jgi:class 3 adenylate cyclase/tetratricopeptide (TPR) repeat protein